MPSASSPSPSSSTNPPPQPLKAAGGGIAICDSVSFYSFIFFMFSIGKRIFPCTYHSSGCNFFLSNILKLSFCVIHCRYGFRLNLFLHFYDIWLHFHMAYLYVVLNLGGCTSALFSQLCFAVQTLTACLTLKLYFILLMVFLKVIGCMFADLVWRWPELEVFRTLRSDDLLMKGLWSSLIPKFVMVYRES